MEDATCKENLIIHLWSTSELNMQNVTPRKETKGDNSIV
jgi:hypothetical protein